MANHTTNARIVRADAPDPAQHFTDLPDPHSLELGTEVTTGQQQQATAPVEESSDIDKRIAELERQLKDKDTFIGRQSNEIGHLRDLSDQLLKGQTQASAQVANASSAEEEVQLSSDELFENPTKALQRVITPMLRTAVDELRNDVKSVQQETVQTRFARAHPTFEKDMNDPKFVEFVQKSKYRQRLAAKAYQQSDFDAADELWNAWEEVHADDSAAVDDSQGDLENTQNADTQQQQLRDAQTVRGGGSDMGNNTKPIYSARKLQDMRIQDPDGYYSPAFQKLVVEAYREGRVR